MLVTLCVTEITSWGVLYYAFPVLATEINADTGWSVVSVTAAFSGSLLMAALVGIWVGRVLDRRGPRAVMTAGSVLAVPAVLLIAAAQNLAWFCAAWLLAGVAMGAVLYPPAFAALTRWYGPRRVRALTVLTLGAGLASTVFAPLTAALAAHLSWRGVYVVLAIVLAVVTVPGHALGLRGPWPEPVDEGPATAARAPARVLRSRAFIALVAALALSGFVASAVVINLVPLLVDRGIDPATAALALGLGGAGQVLGRLGYSSLARRLGVRARLVLVLLGVASTTALLGVLTSAAALIVAATVAGTARGILTLLNATAVTDRWGAAHYGRLTGVLSAPLTVTTALAPWAGAGLAAVVGGYSPMLLVLAASTLGATALALASTPPQLSERKSCATSS